jgi:hypothetical protein
MEAFRKKFVIYSDGKVRPRHCFLEMLLALQTGRRREGIGDIVLAHACFRFLVCLPVFHHEMSQYEIPHKNFSLYKTLR